MSETKHTPGPWEASSVYLDNEPNRYYVHQAGWGGRNVADCGLAVGGEWDVNEANARLIASAPDLLKALQSFVDDVEAAYPHPEDLAEDSQHDCGWPDLFDTYQHARAAIAKATGAPTTSPAA